MPIEIVNKFYIGGLQQFDQHTQLNSIEISINNSEIIDTLARYRQHKYCFLIMPLSFSSSNTDDTYAILIPCSSLNSPKEGLINGETYETLEVINLSEVRNLENVKSDSKWGRHSFWQRYSKIWSFCLRIHNWQHMGHIKFFFLLVNNKAELIIFPSMSKRYLSQTSKYRLQDDASKENLVSKNRQWQ